jgi:DNA-binding response OmpR family regulator
MKTKRVLIIEDNIDLLNMIRVTFELEECTIGECSCGRTGLKKINIFRPDIVILDIMMPEMDGNEVLKKIKEQELDLLIIIFSNLEWHGEQTKNIKYLKKSSTPPCVLVQKIKEFMVKAK